MGQVKESLAVVSLNQLCILTGKQSRTIKSRLSDIKPTVVKGTMFYRPKEALPIIYRADLGLSDKGLMDPQQEKARLDKLKADKIEIEIKVLKKGLVSMESVKSDWEKVLAAFRAKLINLPVKVATKLVAQSSAKKVERILRTECNEALKELSAYSPDE